MQSQAPTDLDVAALEHADKKLKRRRYKRDRMREYTRGRHEEKEALLGQCAALEEQVQALQLHRTAPLTWKEIATALRYAHDADVSKLAVLRSLAIKNTTLLRHLQAWTTLNAPPQVSLSASVSTWHDVTLSGDPSTRLLGQRWITQRMLHHLAAMFQTHEFPSSSGHSFDDLSFDFDGDGHYAAVQRSQFHVPIRHDTAVPPPSHAIFDACHRHLAAFLMLPPNVDPMMEVTGHTNMLRVVTSYGEAINLVCGHFHVSPTRYEVRISAANDDNTLQWRVMHVLPQAKTDAGVLSMQNEARKWGLDLERHATAAFVHASRLVCSQLARHAMAAAEGLF
ncbi:hypothetical protein, variant 1 [Aphanomyces astaci]|uniref:Uncharacterized protein n=1 Tax=Aphanomyces astaci TaxID=112090 RepID=W4FY12_APHAT|nr:hypothetical protein, variant 1 [Aphanomyces astaci]ETV71856.1 hypothetical protein, variant 1 [Aphanomyces astaci]|eukprot:XP_009838706.1 hypothetical protein, variant 1 [Aphanomyces astaci]